MLEDCKVKISMSGQYISNVLKKNGLLKQNSSECKAGVCPKCGYVELYVIFPDAFK